MARRRDVEKPESSSSAPSRVSRKEAGEGGDLILEERRYNAPARIVSSEALYCCASYQHAFPINLANTIGKIEVEAKLFSS